MIFALLPVKARENAKQRLSPCLTPPQRAELALAMYQEVLETLLEVRGLDRVIVVTSDASAARHARNCGVDVFEEHEQLGHSHSADAASARALAMGASTVMLLPADVPLVTAAEIESLIDGAGSGVLIVPSADGAGTNALVRTPPDAIPSCFGPGSFRAHVEQAQARGISFRVARPPGLLFDIDTPGDLAELLRRAPASRIADLVRSQRLIPQ